MADVNSGATEQSLRVFMALGRPQGSYAAFFDMHEDDILFSNSGVHLTVGDIRNLQAYLIAHGVEPQDRLTQLMRGLPRGTPQ